MLAYLFLFLGPRLVDMECHPIISMYLERLLAIDHVQKLLY